VSKTPTRIYTVTNNNTGRQRLVEATHPNVALSHVARAEFTVDTTDAKEAATLVAAGVEVETVA